MVLPNCKFHILYSIDAEKLTKRPIAGRVEIYNFSPRLWPLSHSDRAFSPLHNNNLDNALIIYIFKISITRDESLKHVFNASPVKHSSK